MLAYVFWHWPYLNVDKKAYEEGLLTFHRSLAARKPTGFQYSVVFRMEGAPWVGAGVEAYEDWYIVEGSYALDLLNEAAVSHSSKEPHDQVAHSAAGGAGGLYRFRNGTPNVDKSQFAVWLSKPNGTPYDAFYTSLYPWTSQPGNGLWGRQMVLGPSPEFCLLSPEEIGLPKEFAGLTLRLDPIWSIE